MKESKIKHAECESYLKNTKWNFSQKIDVVCAGLTARALETCSSMFLHTPGTPENSLLVLLRHLFEVTVKLRYLSENPELRITVFEHSDFESRLKLLGKIEKPGDSEKQKNARAYLLAELPNLKHKMGQNIPVDRETSVKGMCDAVGSKKLYDMYRILSSVEHSNIAGLENTVFEKKSGKVDVVVGKTLDKEMSELVWKNTEILIDTIKESIEILNSHRAVESV